LGTLRAKGPDTSCKFDPLSPGKSGPDMQKAIGS
jgi:hypothetical protein